MGFKNKFHALDSIGIRNNSIKEVDIRPTQFCY